MSIQELTERLNRLENRLRGGLTDVVAVAVGDLCADVAQRVINSGKDSEGGKFSSYSTKQVPAYWYYGRSRNAGAEQRVKAAAKKGVQISYSDFRTLNNLPTAYKNFSFSNEMWRGFGLKKVQFAGGKYTAEIGGKTEASADKIAWMTGQEGKNIVAPSAQELARLKAKIEISIVL